MAQTFAAKPMRGSREQESVVSSQANSDRVQPLVEDLIHLLKAGNDIDAKRVLQALRTQQRSSSLMAHLNKIVHKVATQGGLHEAFWVLRSFRAEGFEADIVTFNSLLSACSNSVEASMVWQSIRESDLKPSKVTLTGMVFACIRGGDVLSAEGWFFMPGLDLEPCTYLACQILKAYTAQGQVHFAKEFVTNVVQRGIALHHAKLFNLIIPCLCESCNPHDGVWLSRLLQLSQQQMPQQSGRKQTQGMLHAILGALESAGLPTPWQRRLQWMARLNQVPDADAFRTMLMACGLFHTSAGQAQPLPEEHRPMVASPPGLPAPRQTRDIWTGLMDEELLASQTVYSF